MRSRSAILAFALAALAAPFVHAQYSVGTYPCGAASSTPLQCNGMPVTLNGTAVGTAWLHDYLSGSGPDYIIWQDGMELVPEAIIGKSGCSIWTTFTSGTHVASQCTFLAVYFHHGLPGDVDYYTGNGTFHFTYAYSNSAWRRTETAGAINIVWY